MIDALPGDQIIMEFNPEEPDSSFIRKFYSPKWVRQHLIRGIVESHPKSGDLVVRDVDAREARWYKLPQTNFLEVGMVIRFRVFYDPDENTYYYSDLSTSKRIKIRDYYEQKYPEVVSEISIFSKVLWIPTANSNYSFTFFKNASSNQIFKVLAETHDAKTQPKSMSFDFSKRDQVIETTIPTPAGDLVPLNLFLSMNGDHVIVYTEPPDSKRFKDGEVLEWNEEWARALEWIKKNEMLHSVRGPNGNQYESIHRHDLGKRCVGNLHRLSDRLPGSLITKDSPVIEPRPLRSIDDLF